MRPIDITLPSGYRILQKEPEGWLKAFEVREGDEVLAVFSYFDSACRYIDDLIEWKQENHRKDE